MATPAITCRIDWADKGAFTGAFDTVVPLAGPGETIKVSRGASANLNGEADAVLEFELDNQDGAYSIDRNWLDNPSFEVGTEGFSVAAVPSLTAAATSISQVTDNAPSAGTKAGEVVLTATSNSGVTFRIPYPFQQGVTYSLSVWLKSTAGNLNVRAGLASEGTPADIASTGSNITTSWAQYTATWTPSSDRLDAVFFLRTTTAATATVRVDAIQVNPGSTANTYIEAPTRGMLTGRRPVHLYATWSASDTAVFYGYVSRVSPDPASEKVKLVCYDQLKRLAGQNIVVPPNDYASHTARTMRRAVLEDAERGVRNLLLNPSFETNTIGWSVSAGTLTRTTTDAAPNAGSAYGSYVSGGADRYAYTFARLAPIYLEGETYRFSVYLKVASGTATWSIGIGTDLFDSGPLYAERDVVVTTSWKRFTITYTMPADITASSQTPLAAWVKSTASATVRIDAAAITRGQALHPYADTGTGRWPNWVGEGDFEGQQFNVGWYDAWTNLITNSSFESNTTGWSTAGDAFVGVASSITRVASDPVFGSARADVVTAGTLRGVFFAITGTFVAGDTYDWGVYVKHPSASVGVTAGIGSQGTPSDFDDAFNGTVGSANYSFLGGTWTPLANRTDVHFFVELATADTLRVDGAFVFRRQGGVQRSSFQNTGPGGGGVRPNSMAAIDSILPLYGLRAMSAATPATANAGIVYDFNHYGSWFASGRQYVVSLWLYPTSSMPYKVGIGSDTGTGSFDEASTTGTATANTWTQITLTWTPSADRDSGAPMETVLYVYQTDATARTFQVDGVRVIPGSAADEFEMAHWELAMNDGGEAEDRYLASASLSGDALSALETLNGLTLTRHWIRPEMTDPFYTYVTEDRVGFKGKASVTSFTETIDAWDGLDLDEDSVVNIVGVSWVDGQDFYSDSASVEANGEHAGASISGAAFFPDRSIADMVGPALVERYKDQRTRPNLTVVNEFTKQLLVDLNDVITATIERFQVRAAQYVVLRIDLSITEGGYRWETVYALEEYPY